MPKVIKPLSDTQIRRAKPKEKEYNLSDGQGLQLRVKPSGTKVWLFNYKRPGTQKRTNFSVGRYPALTLSEARKLRDEALVLLSSGIDPAEHKAKLDAEKCMQDKYTLKHVCSLWFSVKESSVTPDYANDIWRSLELHIFPKLGKISVNDIRPATVIKTLSPLAEKGSLETVKRICQRLNEAMTYAVNTGILDANYLSGVKHAFQSPTATNMPTIKPEELGQLLVDLHNANIRRSTRLLIEWQLHTMVRPSEASGARWSEIDFENKQWNIPAERMKKKIAHTVPLTDSCIKLLHQAKKLHNGSAYIFPADRKRSEPTNPQTANMALKRMGYGGKLVAHGLRALASTTLNEQGFAPDLIETALAHIDKDSVRRAYNRAKYIERRRPMMEWWSNHIINAYIQAM